MDFGAFPQKFIDLLELCLSESGKPNPKLAFLINANSTLTLPVYMYETWPQTLAFLCFHSCMLKIWKTFLIYEATCTSGQCFIVMVVGKAYKVCVRVSTLDKW